MAKYRITSIPQSLPKAQRGGLKKLSNNIQNFIYPRLHPRGNKKTTPVVNEPMTGVQNNFGYNFNSQDLPTVEQVPTYDIGAQDYSRPRTPEEEANTFSQITNWTQGETIPEHDFTYKSRNYLRNPIAESAYRNSLEKKLGLPYAGNQREEKTIKIPEQFIPDYHAPFTETGEPLVCGEGKIPYKGQCITEEAFQLINQEEIAQEDYTKQKKQEAFDLRREKARIEDSERRSNDYDESAKKYYETFNKSKKGDKIKPFQSLPTHVTNSKTPVIDGEGNPVLGEDGQPLMESLENQLKNKYLVIKNDRGFTDLYPLDIVNKRIIKNGFQANDFKNSWGLDSKQVEEQMGPLMKGAMENYTSEVEKFVVKKAVNEGKTTDQVISELSPKVGTKTGLKTKFAEPTKKIIDDVYAQVQEELVNSLSGPTKSSWLDDNIFLSDNPVSAFEKSKTSMTNPGEYLGYIKNKYERGDKEYNKYKKDPKNNYNPNYTYANIDDQFADMRSQVAAKKRVDYEVGAQEARKEGELKEFNDGLGKYISNLSANDLKYFINKALTKAGTTQAGKLDILNTFQNHPERIYKTLLELESDEKINGKTQTYSDLFSDVANTSFAMAAKHNKENIKNWNGINENDSNLSRFMDVARNWPDALYFAAHPKEEMWGDFGQSYQTRKKIKEETGVDMGIMGSDNPLGVLRDYTRIGYLNPFDIGATLGEGFHDGKFLSTLGELGMKIGLKEARRKLLNMNGWGNNLPMDAGLKEIGKSLGSVFNNPAMNLGMFASAPENFKDAYDEFQAGNYKSAAWNGFLGYSGAMPAFRATKNLLKYGQTPNTSFNLGVTTPSGKYYGLKQIPNKDLTYAINNQVLAEDLGVGLNNQKGYKSMMKQVHPDISLYPEKIATEAAANLGSLRAVPKIKTEVPSFNRTYPTNINTGEIGVVENDMVFNLGKNYKLNIGSNVFKPQTLEEILLRPTPEGYNFFPSNKNYSRFNTQTLLKKNGGALQRLQGGGGVGKVVKALQELKPIVPEAKTISNQLSLFGADDFTNIIPVAQSGPIANFNVPVVGQTMPVVNNTVRFDLEKQIKKPNKFIYETNQDDDFLTSITKNKENDILRAYVENESGLGKTNMFDNEIKNLDQYTQFLDTYTSYLLPPKHKKFYKDLIEKIKQQDNFASKKQNEELQRLKTGNFDFTRKVYGSTEPKFNEGGALPKAQLGKIVNTLKGLGRYANIGTIGTANTLAKTLAPIKINPVHIPTFGMLAGERTMIGPFTGSPLNVLPIGSPIKNNEAFRYFGDTLDYAKLSKTLDSADGPLFRMGKNKIVSDQGQWFEQGARNAAYSSVFGVRANADAPGSNLRYMPSTGRNGVLIGDMSTSNPRILDLNDPGLSLERRFPFSEKTFPINMDKFRNDEFDWRTQGGNLQSLIERYGYAALAAAGLAGVGTTAPQEYLDKYVTNPIKQGYHNVEDLLTNPWAQPKRKEGGALPKAQYGLESIGKMLKPTNAFRNTINSLHNVDDILPGISPIMRSMSKPKNTFIKTDVPKVDLTKYLNSSGGKSAIRYGNEPHPGEEWYNIDSADYATNWKEEGLTDASDSLKKYLLNSPEHGPDLFKGVGEFKFKDLSDGWAARNAMMNMASDPQKMLGESDFFSPSEFKNFLTQQKKWEAAKFQFDEMNPEDPATAMFRAFSGNHERNELFSNLFPNASLPNFRSKFTTPEQESFLRESDLENFTIPKRNALSKVSLNALSKNNNSTDKLPRSYQDLINASKDNFLTTSPAKDVVMEMRGVLGLKMEDIKNATPEQLEKWRQKIITNMNKQKFDRWKYDISVPFTGGNAYKQISDTPGYKNKKGGVVTSLSKKEIDQYVRGGYIIEDE